MSSAGKCYSGSLWSLEEIMRSVDVAGLLSVARTMGIWSTPSNNEDIVEDEQRKRNISNLTTYYDPMVGIGLAASVASKKRLIKALQKEGCKWKDIEPLSEELIGRMIDECRARKFFALTLREAEYFERPRTDWQLAITRFPNIVDDVEEASKCYALSRYPAAVFHSIQIVEAGLVELGKFLKVNDPYSGWTAVASALNKVIIKSHKDRTTFERKNFQFLEQLQGTVEALKNAWRNKISHSEGKLVVMGGEFNPDVSEEILIATRAFMRRLAEGLPAPKKKDAS